MTKTTDSRLERPAGVWHTQEAVQAAVGLSCTSPKVLTGYTDGVQFGRYRVNQDVWQQIGQQKMLVCSEHEWLAECTQSGAPETGVKTYPDSECRYTDWATDPGPPVSAFSHLATRFAHVMPAGSHSCDWAFDLFFNVKIGAPKHKFLELMVLTQWKGVSFPNPQFKGIQIGHRIFDIYHSESTNGRFIQMYLPTMAARGTIHWLPIFHWLEKQALLFPDDYLAFIQYGVEVLTTYGAPIDYTLTDFAVDDVRR